MAVYASMSDFLADTSLTHLEEHLKGEDLVQLSDSFESSHAKTIEKLKALGLSTGECLKVGRAVKKAKKEWRITPYVESEEEEDPTPSKAIENLKFAPENPDGGFDLAAAILGGNARRERREKKLRFKRYNDGITETSYLKGEFIASSLKAELARADKIGADGPPPTEVEAVIVGAGIGGIQVASELCSVGVTDTALIERSSALGGVWRWHANPYSRVNTSEPAYRITRPGYEPKTRKDKNTNHTPAYQMLRDQVDTLVALGLDRRVYTSSEVLEVKQRADGKKGYAVSGVQAAQANPFSTKSKLVVLATNRRLGVPRELTFGSEELFEGQFARGLGGDADKIKWDVKKSIIIGMGAFALEHVRTSLERGAEFVSILCRRRGTVCPQIIDWVNFVRPLDEEFKRGVEGDSVVFMDWNAAYEKSGTKPPDCWKATPRMLKPDGHTVSVSDLFFVAHHLEMASTHLGEVSHCTPTGIVTKKDIGEIPDTEVECQLVIKCVGFHENKQNERILGSKWMRGNGLISDQCWAVLEAHLDARVFNAPFGSSYLFGVQFSAKLIALGYKNPDVMTRLLTLPASSDISHFTAGEQLDSANLGIEKCPEVRALMVDFCRGMSTRFNSTLDFEEYINRNEVQWSECHEMLYPRAPVHVQHKVLPYLFRHLLQDVTLVPAHMDLN